MYRITLFFSILFFTVSSVPAQQNVAGIVEKAALKVRSSSLYSYTFVHYAEGALAPHFPRTEGQAGIVIPKAGDRFFFTKAYLKERAAGTAGSEVLINGNDIWVIQSEDEPVLHGSMYRTGAVMFNEQLLAPAYLLPDFEASAQNGAELEATAVLGEIPCHVIRFQSEGGLQLKFWIGQSDYLLYRMEGTTPVYPGSTIVMEFSEIQTEGAFEEHLFLSEIPKTRAIQEFSGPYLPVETPAPDWTVSTYGGKTISLGDLKGKVVVLDFWATWCRPCIQAMPQLQALYEQYKDQGLEVIGLTYEENGDPAGFCRKRDIHYPIAPGDAVAGQYAVSSLPFVYVIGKDGKVLEFFNGYFGDQSDTLLESTVKKALAATVGGD